MRKFWNSLPPGVKGALILLVTLFAAQFILGLMSVRLESSLGLNSMDLWQGHFWRLFTYPLVSSSLLSFFFNGLAFICLAPRLEQSWRQVELWSYCFICAVVAGLVKVAIQPHASYYLTDLTPVIYGLLAAWLKLYGKEEVNFMGIVMVNVKQMVLLVTVISVVFSLLSGARLIDVFIPICGGLGGFGYLCVRWRKNLNTPSHESTSERINRLEL
jgi:membrane associated rhomboid family serine protease